MQIAGCEASLPRRLSNLIQCFADEQVFIATNQVTRSQLLFQV
jgi:hypothetical protein